MFSGEKTHPISDQTNPFPVPEAATGDPLQTAHQHTENKRQQELRQLAGGHSGHINLTRFPIDLKAVERVPAKVVLHYRFMPLELRDGILKVAVNSLNNIPLFDDLRIFLQLEIIPFLARDEDILSAINKYYGIGAEAIEDLLESAVDEAQIHTLASEQARSEVTKAHFDHDEEAALCRFVNKVFYEAYEARATDIHIEPYEEKIRIRYRIDGELAPLIIPPELIQFKSSIISRLKIMAHLDIAERRLPQDGRIKIKVNDCKLDMRISTLPTPYGESVNIRLLSSKIGETIANLGFHQDDIRHINTIISRSHGLVLVTGPTGSGKTSTLYTCLNSLNQDNRKIITIEDPVEYNLEGITQMQVKPKIGFDFARGLRSVLRHDPDIVLIGEIRDSETAEIALRSALTGHLVFSTLHTNSAAQAVTRLMDMGIERYLIADSLECVIAQRLVRVLCPHCKISVQLSAEDKARFNAIFSNVTVPSGLWTAIGCPECNNMGFSGRTVIYEILTLADVLKQLIHNKASADEINAAAIKLGMVPIIGSGLEKVLKGITTLDEVFKVTNRL
jgi:type II secretory ATPase GspE/PulE/Tfp pilus assembly ATPase PilB-like protein